jgi:uncharacterized protein (DUF362 family)
MNKVIVREFKSYNTTVFSILEQLGFGKDLDEYNRVIIKPNLLQDTPPPCTTDVRCVEAVARFIREISPGKEIVILEGSGGCDTERSYKTLGYEEIASSLGIKLLDVDQVDLKKLEDPEARVYKEIFLPEIIFDSYLISVPSLKDHSIAGVTLSLKNLIGLLPEKHYGNYWSYKRSDVHRVGVSSAVADLARYVDIGMSIIDGRLGQQGSHLAGGRHCDPYKNVIIGGYNSLSVDMKGAEVLGHDWRDIEHLVMIGQDNER